jgi:hypothetical protein
MYPSMIRPSLGTPNYLLSSKMVSYSDDSYSSLAFGIIHG